MPNWITEDDLRLVDAVCVDGADPTTLWNRLLIVLRPKIRIVALQQRRHHRQEFEVDLQSELGRKLLAARKLCKLLRDTPQLFYANLMKVIENTGRDLARTLGSGRRRVIETVGGDLELDGIGSTTAKAGDVDSEVVDAVFWQVFMEALRARRPRAARVLELSVRGFTYVEIADELGVDRQTVARDRAFARGLAEELGAVRPAAGSAT